jgi:hypothetical protein
MQTAAGEREMQTKCAVVAGAAFVALLGTVVATAVPAGAQGPGCHFTMNQAACVACVRKNAPQLYDPVGSPRWCARMIAERRAQIPSTKAEGKGPTITRTQCIRECISRGPDRTAKTCDPWCVPGCRYSGDLGKHYCVRG